MFTGNSNFPQQNTDKIFTIEESQKQNKRKSISFCMNEETMKDASFYQNYFNNDISISKTNQDPKSECDKSSVVLVL